MTIEGATEGGSGVPSLPSTTGSMRASSSPTSASSPASDTLEHPPRSPAAPSEHSSAETESGAQEPARSPEILTNISCANDAELSFLLKLFQSSLCKVKTGRFVPIFSRGGPRLNGLAPAFRLLQIIEDFLQSQGKTNEMSHGSTKGDIKYVLMTMLQQRVGQELGSAAEEQAKKTSLKKVNVLASSRAPILPEDWQQLFEKYQSSLTDQVYCVKHVELVRNPKFAPSHDKDAALWNAFVEFYRSKQCPLEPCFQSCLSASCEMQISPRLPELGGLELFGESQQDQSEALAQHKRPRLASAAGPTISSSYSAAHDHGAFVIQTLDKVVIVCNVPGHSSRSLSAVDGEGRLLLQCNRINNDELSVVIPPLCAEALEVLTGKDSQPGPSLFAGSETAFDGDVAKKILNLPEEQRNDALHWWLDKQKTPRSRSALASLGNVIHNSDVNLWRRPHDGSAKFTLTVPGELERNEVGGLVFMPEIEHGMLFITIKRITPAPSSAQGGFAAASSLRGMWD